MDIRINKLSKDIYDKIAAGEVVERPVSIVKELIENSVDASSTQITIEIEHGGKKRIVVSDNGSGIHQDDLMLAFERHATSKIRSESDIFNISTLGFRGEALSSISAVSSVTLATKRRSEESGFQISIKGGVWGELKKVGVPDGTRLQVDDLFFNTPARLKFLKSDAKEQMAITDLVSKLAVSNPDISFRYYVDGRMSFATKGDGNVKNVISSVYGTDISKNLIPVKAEKGDVSVTGFVSNLSLSRSNRSMQLLFVNGRYVRSDMITESIRMAYSTGLPSSRFPVSFLFVEVDPFKIDVNIHPTKTQIKFSNTQELLEAVYSGIRSSLSASDLSVRPSGDSLMGMARPSSMMRKQDSSKQLEIMSGLAENAAREMMGSRRVPEAADSDGAKAAAQPEPGYGQRIEDEPALEVSTENTGSGPGPCENMEPETLTRSEPSPEVGPEPEESADPFLSMIDAIISHDEQEKRSIGEDGEDYSRATSSSSSGKPPAEADDNALKSDDSLVPDRETVYDGLSYIGQYNSSYLLFEGRGELYMIDQHAAHEKVIYEELMAQMKNRTLEIQPLLIPITITLSVAECERLMDSTKSFSDAGISIEQLGENSIVIREIPHLLTGLENTQSFKDFVIDLLQGVKGSGDLLSIDIGKLISMSCKSAVKANTHMDRREAMFLLERLKTLDEPYTCPHGRPVIVSMTRNSIDRLFMRT